MKVNVFRIFIRFIESFILVSFINGIRYSQLIFENDFKALLSIFFKVDTLGLFILFFLLFYISDSANTRPQHAPTWTC